MSEGWKEEALGEMDIPWVELAARDWALLFLYTDGQKPVKGEESFHVALFMMRSPPLSFKPLLLSVFSRELHDAIKGLVNEGLVKRDYVYERGRLVEVYTLSPRGAQEASRLLEKLRSSWVLVGGLVAREGSKVVSEVEALKKTYNGRGVTACLKLMLDKLDSPDNVLDAWFEPSEVEYLKKLYRAYRREFN